MKITKTTILSLLLLLLSLGLVNALDEGGNRRSSPSSNRRRRPSSDRRRSPSSNRRRRRRNVGPSSDRRRNIRRRCRNNCNFFCNRRQRCRNLGARNSCRCKKSEGEEVKELDLGVSTTLELCSQELYAPAIAFQHGQLFLAALPPQDNLLDCPTVRIEEGTEVTDSLVVPRYATTDADEEFLDEKDMIVFDEDFDIELGELLDAVEEVNSEDDHPGFKSDNGMLIVIFDLMDKIGIELEDPKIHANIEAFFQKTLETNSDLFVKVSDEDEGGDEGDDEDGDYSYSYYSYYYYGDDSYSYSYYPSADDAGGEDGPPEN